MLLTKEQEEILYVSARLSHGETIKINAFAGTGKTTTLVAIANQSGELTFLYIAFNNSIVKEARKKFPKNVVIYTWHSLALQTIDKTKYTIRREDYDLLTLQTILGVGDDFELIGEAMRIFRYYLLSDCYTIKEAATIMETSKAKPILLAEKLYKMMDNAEIEITHDFYLKKFSLNTEALSKLSSKYDCFLLDEAQDCNPVTLKIFNSLKGRKILVGDTYQQIYQFRGSINAMSKIKSEHTFFLTYTFRCSKNVVNRANAILKNYLGSDKFLVSKNTSEPVIKTIAYITRTNAMLIELISIFNDEGQEFILSRGTKEIFGTTENMYYFLTNKHDKLSKEYQYLKRFESEFDLLEFANKYDMVELKSSVKLAKRYGGYIFVLKEAAKRLSNKKSHITLTTAHASKGLEWDRVFLTNDFKELGEIESVGKLTEEGNLLYVAITRAKYEILKLEKEK